MVDADFNWVSVRSRCSFAKVFQQLKLEIEADVETRNRERGKATYYEFSVVSSGHDRFVVLLSGEAIQQRLVIFKLQDTNITVYKDRQEDIMFEATLTVSNDGYCRFKINGQEYDFWQLRKKALEELFFDIVRSN